VTINVLGRIHSDLVTRFVRQPRRRVLLEFRRQCDDDEDDLQEELTQARSWPTVRNARACTDRPRASAPGAVAPHAFAARGSLRRTTAAGIFRCRACWPATREEGTAARS
jgi:hypothetical protein